MNRILAVFLVLAGVVPSSRGEEELITNIYVVPPRFDAYDGLPQKGGAKNILENAGIVFGPGAMAVYHVATSRLAVRNTKEQMERVEAHIESIVAKFGKPIYVSVREASFQGNLSKWMKNHSGWTPGDPEIEAKLSGLFGFPGGDQEALAFPFGGPRESFNWFHSYESFKEELARPPKVSEERRIRIAGSLTDSEFQMLVRWLSQMKEIEFHTLPSVVIRSGQPVITQAENRRYGVVAALGADESAIGLDLFLPEHGKALSGEGAATLEPTVQTTVRDGATVVVAEKNADGRNRLVFVTAQIVDPVKMPKTEETPSEEAVGTAR